MQWYVHCAFNRSFTYNTTKYVHVYKHKWIIDIWNSIAFRCSPSCKRFKIRYILPLVCCFVDCWFPSSSLSLRVSCYFTSNFNISTIGSRSCFQRMYVPRCIKKISWFCLQNLYHSHFLKFCCQFLVDSIFYVRNTSGIFYRSTNSTI